MCLAPDGTLIIGASKKMPVVGLRFHGIDELLDVLHLFVDRILLLQLLQSLEEMGIGHQLLLDVWGEGGYELRLPISVLVNQLGEVENAPLFQEVEHMKIIQHALLCFLGVIQLRFFFPPMQTVVVSTLVLNTRL